MYVYCSKSEVQCVQDHLFPSGRHQYFSSNPQMPKQLEWDMNYEKIQWYNEKHEVDNCA